MSFGISIGDFILCSQLTYRLLVAATSGRKDAPCGLEELEDILFALSCSLNHLQRTSMSVLSKYEADEIRDQLGLMLHSCRGTLEDLEIMKAKYREAGNRPVSTSDDHKSLRISSRSVLVQVKTQWQRFIWDLQGKPLGRYRQKLQSHTDALNIFLATLIWSATDRIEKDGQRQGKRVEVLLHQATHFNSELFHLMHHRYHPTAPHRSSTLPEISASNKLS